MPSQKITHRIYFPIGSPFPTNILIFLLYFVGSVSKEVPINFSVPEECQHKGHLTSWLICGKRAKVIKNIHYSAHPSLHKLENLYSNLREKIV